jgi:hypothetical protein
MNKIDIVETFTETVDKKGVLSKGKVNSKLADWSEESGNAVRRGATLHLFKNLTSRKLCRM